MRVSLEQDGNHIVFQLIPNEDDFRHLESSKIGLAETQARVDLQGMMIDEIHPDLIGLSSILMCHQFVGSELYLPSSVSEKFLMSANGILSKYKICSKYCL